MKKWLYLYIIFTIYQEYIYTKPKYPVDISYLVADVKYSKQHGLKICEIQHGSLSALQGDLYISGNDGTITPQIAHFFTLFSLQKWAAGIIYPPLERSLAMQKWNIVKSFQNMIEDPLFLQSAAQYPQDIFSINSYANIVYADFDIVSNYNYYRKKYPGIIFMNAATFPYWNDKYKMNTLFNENDALKQYKANWKIYPKKYDADLSDKITTDIPAELYVIKPVHESLAHGVIVVENKDLDVVLQMILQPSSILEKHPDKKYAYWYTNQDNNFIIEKYYASDYISCTLPSNNNLSDHTLYTYDATMRLVFILQYNLKKISYHCLGAFWKLPCKALEEEGTLNDKMISCCKPPFYQVVDYDLLQEINLYMEKAMLLLYEVMLNSINQL